MGDNETLCAVEPHLPLKRFPPPAGLTALYKQASIQTSNLPVLIYMSEMKKKSAEEYLQNWLLNVNKKVDLIKARRLS